MKTYKLSFISKKWGTVSGEFMIKAMNESNAITDFIAKLNSENKIKVDIYDVKVQQLID